MEESPGRNDRGEDDRKRKCNGGAKISIHVSTFEVGPVRRRSRVSNSQRRKCYHKQKGPSYMVMSPIRMKYSDVRPTASHRSTPCSSGRQPTSFSVEREMPLPMRKSVAVSPNRPSVKSAGVMREKAETYVLVTAASRKKRMNQGN